VTASSTVEPALAVSPFVSQTLRPFSATGDNQDLKTLAGLIESGDVAPVIDGTFPLRATPEALTHYGTGHTRGKVVITVGRSDQ